MRTLVSTGSLGTRGARHTETSCSAARPLPVATSTLDLPLQPPLKATLVFVLCVAFLTLSTRLRRRWRTESGLLAATLPIIFPLVLATLQEAHERCSAGAISKPVRQPTGMLFAALATVAHHFEMSDGLFSELDRLELVADRQDDGDALEGEDGDRILTSDAE